MLLGFNNKLEGVIKMAVSLAKPVDLTKRKVPPPVIVVRVPANFFKRK